MSRRVFLHVGSPKTGTSYLQSTLAANQTLLAGRGLTYPQTASGSHFEAAIDLTDHPWGGQLANARGEWDRLAASALQAPDTVVISHEVLAAATPEQVARARRSLRDVDVHVVLTVRDLGRQLPAEWQEKVKHRGRIGMRPFVKRVVDAPRTGSSEWFWRVQHVPDVLTRWGAGLPADRVHVITVPQTGADRSLLWRRFATVLGLDPTLELQPGERDNPSLGRIEVAMLRMVNVRLNQRSVPQQVYAELVRDLLARDTLSRRADQTRLQLQPRLRGFVEEVTEEWTEWIEGAGVDVVGDLGELESQWSEEKWVDPDKLTTHPITQAALDSIVALIEHEAARYRESPPGGRSAGLRRRLGL